MHSTFYMNHVLSRERIYSKTLPENVIITFEIFSWLLHIWDGLLITWHLSYSLDHMTSETTSWYYIGYESYEWSFWSTGRKEVITWVGVFLVALHRKCLIAFHRKYFTKRASLFIASLLMSTADVFLVFFRTYYWCRKECRVSFSFCFFSFAHKIPPPRSNFDDFGNAMLTVFQVDFHLKFFVFSFRFASFFLTWYDSKLSFCEYNLN